MAVAIARAKLQLTTAAASDRPDELQLFAETAGDATTAPGDPVARRLLSAFALLPAAPVGGEFAEVRMPRPRPETPGGDMVALAYANEGPAAERLSTEGLTAIEVLVQQHAVANDVPPALAQALVQIESSHNPKATGRNGEIGLLQIKPQTARAMGYRGSAKGLYDPETNLAWGMKYLGRAHELSGGDTCGTLLRYNAGLDARRKSAASNRFCAKVKAAMAKRA